MAITPTALLSLPLITTGTESGSWGEVVDNGLTSYLDIAIAGGLAITITTADVTLANTAGTSSVTAIGSTTAQYAVLNVSGAMTAARSLIIPSSSKTYVINNTCTGGFLLTVKGSATTGVTVQNGETAYVAWNGSDYVKVSGFTKTNNVSYTDYLNETSTTLINKPTLMLQRAGAQTNGTGNAGYISFTTNGPSSIGTYEAGKIDVTFLNSAGTLGVGKMVMAIGNSTGSYTTRIELDGTSNNGNINSITSANFTWVGDLGETMRLDSAGNLQVQSGAIMPYAPTPTPVTTTATLTNADIQGQIINTTGTTYTVTMPLGSTLQTLATWAANNVSYDFYVINTASGTITMAVNTGVTSLGGLTIATGVSAHFRIRKTGTNTFVLYRLS